MLMFLLILQWILALIAICAFGLIWKSAWGQNWLIAVLGFLIFPLFPIVYAFYAGIQLKKGELKYPAITYAVCVALAVLLQRVRLGYWGWPDVGA